MVISPFPVFPFPFGQVVFYSPTFSRTYAISLSWNFLGGIPPRFQAALHFEVPVELHFCIEQSCRPSIIWLLGSALCVWVCFSCFLTWILFGGVGISLSRWSPSQDILQSICEPETTRNFYFSFDSRRSLSLLHVANSFCKSQGMFSLQNNSLKTHTHTHTCTHIQYY